MQTPADGMERGDVALARVIELERALLSAEVRGSRKLLGDLLDEDFREIGASGKFWNRAELIEVIAESPPLEDLDADEFEATELAPGMVLVAWQSRFRERAVRRSSLWRYSAGSWRLMFHQGTPVPGAHDAPSDDT